MKHSFNILVFALLTAALLPCQMTLAQDEFSDFERKQYDLDYEFEAFVLLNDGEKIHLRNFHLSKWLLRHMVQTGEGLEGLNLPLANIKRIVRRDAEEIWVDVVFLNNSEMHSRWSLPEIQKVYGIDKNGEEWHCEITEVREIVVKTVDDGSRK